MEKKSESVEKCVENESTHSLSSISQQQQKKIEPILLFTIHDTLSPIYQFRWTKKKSTMNIDTRMITIEFRTARRNRTEIRFIFLDKKKYWIKSVLLLNGKISWYVSFGGGEQWENCLPAKGKKFNLFVRNKDGKNFSTIQKKLVHSELNDATPDCSEKINFYATMWTVATNDKEDTEDKGREQKEEWMKKKTQRKWSNHRDK